MTGKSTCSHKWLFAEPGRTEPCGFDDCRYVGHCDGRHCEAASGAIRYDPDLDNGVAHRDWFALAAEPDDTIVARVRQTIGYHFGVSDQQIVQIVRAAIPKEPS